LDIASPARASAASWIIGALMAARSHKQMAHAAYSAALTVGPLPKAWIDRLWAGTPGTRSAKALSIALLVSDSSPEQNEHRTIRGH
jgi:hypothetical protein